MTYLSQIAKFLLIDRHMYNLIYGYNTLGLFTGIIMISVNSPITYIIWQVHKNREKNAVALCGPNYVEVFYRIDVMSYLS